jgi:hypothetical protein
MNRVVACLAAARPRTTRSTSRLRKQHPCLVKIPNGYYPNRSTDVKLPEDFKVTPLQDVD